MDERQAHKEHLRRKYNTEAFAVCFTKKRYATELDAIIGARLVKNKFNADQFPYFCEICLKFHLTSKQRKKK